MASLGEGIREKLRRADLHRKDFERRVDMFVKRDTYEVLRDSDPKVRELTAWALFEIEDPSTAPALQAALRTEQDKDIQLGYIRALAAMGDKSVDAIRPLLESSDQRIKTMAVRALAGGHATGPWPHPWPQPRPYP